ncbi:hypothetical protein [Ferrimonas balearica]|uniref:hypothetical protein n=1 Tax=Ferrimonas balearica TaxID=44012 RepID=UPI001C99F300|nr:hypothetical protein [Ferrimonas balearica]MBY5991776.1 hypothetical protein [Ferrimonas balearica]
MGLVPERRWSEQIHHPPVAATLWLFPGTDGKIATVTHVIYASLVALLIHLGVASPWIKTLLFLLLFCLLVLDFSLRKMDKRRPPV